VSKPQLPVEKFLRLGSMNEYDHITFEELSMIEKIIRDETWLEGERRGCHVSPSDIVVRANVCIAVLRVGAEVREAALKRLAKAKRQRAASRAEPMQHEAA
jgi:hypothetical protein